MSMEITEVHYDPDPKHIIIRSDLSIPSIDCANPIDPSTWLDGTYGEVLCLYDLQYMHFEKNLCENLTLYDNLTLNTFKSAGCLACGILNAVGCCANTTPANSFAVQDDADNCLSAP